MSIRARIEKLERQVRSSENGWLEMPDGERVVIPDGGVSLLKLTLYEMNKWSAAQDGVEPPKPSTENYEPMLEKVRLAVSIREPGDMPGIGGALLYFTRLND
jgi:hypothetical protein